MSLLTQHAWQTAKVMLKILHRLWLEIVGAVFLGLAGFGSFSLWKEWRAYHASGAELWKPLSALVFVIGMAAFGINSLFRARRLR